MQSKSLNILTVNIGSSSLKLAVFKHTDHNHAIARIQVNSIGASKSTISWSLDENNPGSSVSKIANHATALHITLNWLENKLGKEPFMAIGYRIVHGGPKHRQTELINDKVFEELRKFSVYDPDHLPETLRIITHLNKRYPRLYHIACYDSSFFVNLPEKAKRLPLPRAFDSVGMQRFGFHGLSYMYLRAMLSDKKYGRISGKRVVMAHLGSGSSVTALKNFRPIDTTMSFSPTSGIMTSTRSGDIDPSALFYLHKKGGMSLTLLNEVLNKESGLKGVSGVSGDMYTLLQIADSNPNAKEAINMYCYQVAKAIGSYAAAMGGIDALVFSGGIGEKSVPVRENICEYLEFLGIKLDPKANRKNLHKISKKRSRVKIFAFETDESKVIANMVRDQLGLLKKDK